MDRILFEKDRIDFAKDRIVYAGTVYFQVKTVYFPRPYTFKDRILYFSGPYTLQPNRFLNFILFRNSIFPKNKEFYDSAKPDLSKK